ncbi:protein FAM50A [Lingula anatina]|uniref:Protein FAM50A n=1 Tax=Lingula anatina TaxID=7574 RepID=A0A1S3HXV8_LINAN|nr:protein FAM50A [Lingula anatina]|eukprot:XP_013390396.1 protein FAM50A [Lingula anatina]
MAFYKGASKEAGRAMQLIKKRQKEHDEMEAKKKKIEEELQVGSIHNKFAAHYDAIEQQLKSDTVGLVTLDEMKAKQEDVIKEREKQLALKERASKLDKEREKEKKKREKRALQKAMLSFDVEEDAEEEEEEEEEQQKTEEKMSIETEKKKKRLGMNPDVDTSFLPDKDREEEENRIREELRQEWAAKQEELKNENIEITYSYWDGSGHRRTVQMKKGNSIQQFLQRCLETLRKEFAELKSCSVDQLMYVKEDLIIPQHYTFYDFIVTKARGKSGPLFNFDVHDDVRMISDARVEKDESHAGKVCLRSCLFLQPIII